MIFGNALRKQFKTFRSPVFTKSHYWWSRIFCKEVLQKKTKKIAKFCQKYVPHSLNRQRRRNRIFSDTNKFSWWKDRSFPILLRNRTFMYFFTKGTFVTICHLTRNSRWFYKSVSRLDQPHTEGRLRKIDNFLTRQRESLVLYKSIKTHCPHPILHRVDRVLGFFSSRPNWNTPTSSPVGESAPYPPVLPGEGHTRLWEREWGGRGVSIRTRGQTLWYSRYICTLCYIVFHSKTT
jgi:hypothetical protein